MCVRRFCKCFKYADNDVNIKRKGEVPPALNVFTTDKILIVNS